MAAKGVFKFIVGVGLVRFIVKEIAETVKWKAYYEADDSKPLPPGYFTKQYKNSSIKESAKVSTMPKTEAAIADLINNTFDTVKREIAPLEGQTEASKGTQNTDDMEERLANDISAPETSDEDEEGDIE